MRKLHTHASMLISVFIKYFSFLTIYDRKPTVTIKGFQEARDLQVHPQFTKKLVKRDLELLWTRGSEEANDANESSPEFPPDVEEGFVAFLDETVQHLELFLQNKRVIPDESVDPGSDPDLVVLDIKGPSETVSGSKKKQ